MVTTTVLVGLAMLAGQLLADREPVDEWARFAGATGVDGLVIMVERGSGRPAPGRPGRYTIAIGNQQPNPQTITVRATVPPALRLPGADPATGPQLVEWSVSLGPSAVTALPLTGAYAPRGPDLPRWVSLTACAVDPVAGEPIVCATDTGELARSGNTVDWWWLAGAGLLAGGTAAALVLRPDPLWLTPTGSRRTRSRSAA